MKKTPITYKWLDENLHRDKSESGYYITSSKPDQACYNWEINDDLVIDSHPDDGYSLSVKFFVDPGAYEYKTIRRVKTIEDIKRIWEAIHNKKWPS